ncbi:MAG: MIP family channel protein [Actinobacteria bacterium]|nr:MIP family channel protein [Actinomycetota bacterium]
MDNAPARLLAEFVGTFALIFIGAGSIMTAAELAGGGYSLIGIAAAHGFVLAVMISALGHVSGAHFNPAVSLGLLIAKGIKPVEFVAYVITQLVAATVAALALGVIYNTAVKDATGLGTPAISDNYSVGQALLVEGILTFFLVFTVMAVAVDSRGAFKIVAGLPIGFVVFFDILMGGPVTGAAMNPARWFGPALVSGNWSDWWVYLVGPLVGGAIAATIYITVILKRENATA